MTDPHFKIIQAGSRSTGQGERTARRESARGAGHRGPPPQTYIGDCCADTWQPSGLIGGLGWKDGRRDQALMSRAATELAALADGSTGEVRLGAFISAATIVPPALVRLHAEHPAVRITLVEVEQSETYPALLRGDLDWKSPDFVDTSCRRSSWKHAGCRPGRPVGGSSRTSSRLTRSRWCSMRNGRSSMSHAVWASWSRRSGTGCVRPVSIVARKRA